MQHTLRVGTVTGTAYTAYYVTERDCLPIRPSYNNHEQTIVYCIWENVNITVILMKTSNTYIY